MYVESFKIFSDYNRRKYLYYNMLYNKNDKEENRKLCVRKIDSERKETNDNCKGQKSPFRK